MSDEQELHLKSIKDSFEKLVDTKYRQGATEHRSTLSQDYTVEQLLDMSIEEAIDQVTYLLTLRSKL